MDENGVAPEARAPQPFKLEPNGTGIQYEYHRITIAGQGELAHSFNQLGACGWQIIGMNPGPEGMQCWIMRQKGSKIAKPMLHLPNGRG